MTFADVPARLRGAAVGSDPVEVAAVGMSEPLFHTLSASESLKVLNSRLAGLTTEEAEARLAEQGPNELTPPHRISAWLIFWRQWQNLLIIILLLATGISFWLGEHLDAVVILAIVVACVFLGFIQEYRAEKAAAALQELAAPQATVRREGEEIVLPAREVVPGDILLLHTGDRVAADARLLEAVNLMIDEAILTGESTPVTKDPGAVLAPDTPIGDRRNLVFGGTVVAYGRGMAVVTATGMATEFGRIARLLGEVREEATPLERRLTLIGRVLSGLCLGVAALATILGILKGYGWIPMLIWGISLAVAAVPESLPAVVTGALAIGTTRMAKRKAIVKRLPAVETMGCTTVICTDKTGTLTKNEMTARQLYLDHRFVEVTGSGYKPEGHFYTRDLEELTLAHPVLFAAARIAILCNDANLRQEGERWHLRGDPTEGALLTLGLKAGLQPERLYQDYPRVAEIPFDSDRKRMATIHQDRQGFLLCLKGAPESILPYCQRQLTLQGEQPLTAADREDIMAAGSAMAADALRVLGLAYRRLERLPAADPALEEEDLVWVGLVGLLDPPRPEAKEAVRLCHRAGIRVIMVTGDHPQTAAAIARELHILPREGGLLLTGPEVDRLSAAELQEVARRAQVFARVSPDHKLRLVAALKAQGEVVAMTGDGVNDAPALKQADIGVAMGLTGTEVTKETAAMILADDNFATLVAAVEEGRAIYDNIRKYLLYLLSCNLAEVVILTGAFFLGLPLPLLALQILWINLTTDGLPALALGVDPKAPNIMDRPPRPVTESLFNRDFNILAAVIAAYKTLVLLPLFAYYWLANPAGIAAPELRLVHAQTVVFTGLVLLELVNAFNCRSIRLSLFQVGVLKNRFLLVAVSISLLLMVAVVQWAPLEILFHTVPLAWWEWLLLLGLSLLLIPVTELVKWWRRRAAAGS